MVLQLVVFIYGGISRPPLPVATLLSGVPWKAKRLALWSGLKCQKETTLSYLQASFLFVILFSLHGYFSEFLCLCSAGDYTRGYRYSFNIYGCTEYGDKLLEIQSGYIQEHSESFYRKIRWSLKIIFIYAGA